MTTSPSSSTPSGTSQSTEPNNARWITRAVLSVFLIAVLSGVAAATGPGDVVQSVVDELIEEMATAIAAVLFLVGLYYMALLGIQGVRQEILMRLGVSVIVAVMVLIYDDSIRPWIRSITDSVGMISPLPLIGPATVPSALDLLATGTELLPAII